MSERSKGSPFEKATDSMRNREKTKAKQEREHQARNRKAMETMARGYCDPDTMPSGMHEGDFIGFTASMTALAGLAEDYVQQDKRVRWTHPIVDPTTGIEVTFLSTGLVNKTSSYVDSIEIAYGSWPGAPIDLISYDHSSYSPEEVPQITVVRSPHYFFTSTFHKRVMENISNTLGPDVQSEYIPPTQSPFEGILPTMEDVEDVDPIEDNLSTTHVLSPHELLKVCQRIFGIYERSKQGGTSATALEDILKKLAEHPGQIKETLGAQSSEERQQLEAEAEAVRRWVAALKDPAAPNQRLSKLLEEGSTDTE